jgi:pterin-4a-carbinolamine dehydratase
MSEKKTIQINPDLFKVTNTSRKKQNPIKIKSPEKKQKQKTLRKNVLKMIREKQQEEYKRLFDTPEKNSSSNSNSSSISLVDSEFNKDFDESLKFFSSLANKPENIEHHNTTFKKYPENNSILLQPNTPLFIDTNENVNIHLPEVFNTNNTFQIKKPSFILPPPPKYGCLKNGSLPTYKNWHTQTQRVYPNPMTINTQTNPMINTQTNPMTINTNPTINTQINPMTINTQTNPMINTQTNPRPFTFLEKNQEPNIIPKKKEYQNIFNDKNINRIKYKKQKKIFKRTHYVGRSKTKPQIGVLISNRTIRNRISTDAQLLKQTNIRDVRQFLIKKGFIKVGTNSPNDVLRKMYESVSLICGEIQNHNSENLLFNFIHNEK